jgi:(-)-germacrene D synthase
MQFQDMSVYYLQEAEWLHQNHKPSFKDHLSLSAMSIGSPALCVGLMVGMGDPVTREAFEWAAGYPKVAIACGKIARLMDDIAAFKVYSFIFLFGPNYNNSITNRYSR